MLLFAKYQHRPSFVMLGLTRGFPPLQCPVMIRKPSMVS